MMIIVLWLALPAPWPAVYKMKLAKTPVDVGGS